MTHLFVLLLGVLALMYWLQMQHKYLHVNLTNIFEEEEEPGTHRYDRPVMSLHVGKIQSTVRLSGFTRAEQAERAAQASLVRSAANKQPICEPHQGYMVHVLDDEARAGEEGRQGYALVLSRTFVHPICLIWHPTHLGTGVHALPERLTDLLHQVVRQHNRPGSWHSTLGITAVCGVSIKSTKCVCVVYHQDGPPFVGDACSDIRTDGIC